MVSVHIPRRVCPGHQGACVDTTVSARGSPAQQCGWSAVFEWQGDPGGFPSVQLSGLPRTRGLKRQGFASIGGAQSIARLEQFCQALSPSLEASCP